jgi:hypothetical protein
MLVADLQVTEAVEDCILGPLAPQLLHGLREVILTRIFPARGEQFIEVRVELADAMRAGCLVQQKNATAFQGVVFAADFDLFFVRAFVKSENDRRRVYRAPAKGYAHENLRAALALQVDPMACGLAGPSSSREPGDREEDRSHGTSGPTRYPQEEPLGTFLPDGHLVLPLLFSRSATAFP